jgi:hypothetical protein
MIVKRTGKARFVVGLTLTAAMIANCGGAGLNPAFVNTLTGGVVPVTPGPGAAFVLVRCVNDATQPVEFIVTVERDIIVRDENGNAQVDENGDPITTPLLQTVQLATQATGTAKELGTLFACGESPISRVGLGENLEPTDIAAFVGGQGAGGAAGFGVPATGVNPLQLDIGNFNCGDTVIYRAFLSSAVAGGVALQTLLLPGSEQPDVFSGPNTFVNYATLIASQLPEEEP